MRERHEFVDYVIELLGPFGTVSAKRMFGGHGIYLDGLMFAIVAREGVWLKADEINRIEFEEKRCEVFTYSRGGAQATIGFYRAPAEALESAGEMLPWARSAYAAALRANSRRLALERERAERVAARELKAAVIAAAAAPGKRAAPARPTASRSAAKRAAKKRISAKRAPTKRSTKKRIATKQVAVKAAAKLPATKRPAAKKRVPSKVPTRKRAVGPSRHRKRAR